MGSSGPIKAATSPLNKIKDKVSGVVAPAAAVAQAPFDTAKKARRELNTAADDTSNAASRLARGTFRGGVISPTEFFTVQATPFP